MSKPKNARAHYNEAHKSQFTRQSARHGDVVMARHCERLLEAQWEKTQRFWESVDRGDNDISNWQPPLDQPDLVVHDIIDDLGVGRAIQVNPECAAGKHSNCSGTGWDLHQDEPTGCPCHCHHEG